MDQWIGYALLLIGFCGFSALVIGLIAYFIFTQVKKSRSATGTKAAATRAVALSSRPATNPAPVSHPPQTGPKVGSVSKAVPSASAVSVAPPGGFTPIYLNFSNKPQAILNSMAALTVQAGKVNASKARWGKGPRLLFWSGLGLMMVEGLVRVLGYSSSCVFLFGGVALWIIAIFLSVGLRRAQMQAFSPRFNEFEQIIHTLRDDLRPGAGFLGNLDLTGAKQASKVAREANDAQNRTTQYFRDQWLNFKAKLYDGNILRISGIQWVKERKGFYKRSRISGKMKWKPAKFKGSYQELKVRIAVNPEVYKIVPNSKIGSNNQVGDYTISAVDTEGGIVTVLASSGREEVSAQSVLGVLKFAYGLLQLKKA